MQVEVRIDDSYSEPKVIILTDSMTEEINKLVQKLSENNPQIISGSKDGRIEILEPNDLFQIYACNGRVLAVSDHGEYVLLQAFLCGILGMGFAASSVIWEMEDWGIVKQTGVYFLIVSVIMMPIAYITFWMEHSLRGIANYFGIFIFVFAIVWVVQYIRGRYNVKKMNEALRRRQ